MSKEVVLCLNGVEFTPSGKEQRVCWPWERTSVGQDSITLRDRQGEIETFGRDSWILYIGSTNGWVARRLHARKQRERMDDGLKVVIDPKTFRRMSWWVPLGCGLLCVLMVALLCSGAPLGNSSGKAFAIAVMGFLGAAFTTRLRLSQNVGAMTVTANGMDVRFHDGRSAYIRWREVESREGGRFRTVNGLVVQPAWSPQLRQALLTCRAVKPSSLGRYRRRLSFWFWPGLVGFAGSMTALMLMVSKVLSFGAYDALARLVFGHVFLVGMFPVMLRFKQCLDLTFARRVRYGILSMAPQWAGHQAPGEASAGTIEAR